MLFEAFCVSHFLLFRACSFTDFHSFWNASISKTLRFTKGKASFSHSHCFANVCFFIYSGVVFNNVFRSTSLLFRCRFVDDFLMVCFQDFNRILHQNGSQNGSQMVLKIDLRAEGDFGMHFGHFLAPFWRPLAHFWRPLAPFWCPLARFWRPLAPF